MLCSHFSHLSLKTTSIKSSNADNVLYRYLESLHILYATNTFIINKNPPMLIRLCRLWPANHLSMITSLDLQLVNQGWPTQTPMQLYGETFQLLASDMFNQLENLHVIIRLRPRDQVNPRDGYLLNEEQETAWSQPWETLLATRPSRWKELKVTVPLDWEFCFRELYCRRINLHTSAFRLMAQFDSFDRSGVVHCCEPDWDYVHAHPTEDSIDLTG